MAEDIAEQERQPIISNLFPIGEKSVLRAFRDLSPRENPSGVQAEEEKERRILRETNRHVLTSFEIFLEFHTEENAKQMLRGALIFH